MLSKACVVNAEIVYNALLTDLQLLNYIARGGKGFYSSYHLTSVNV